MKKVLAELHQLINNLEDYGLIAEASTLQEVFVRVAQEADIKDDLKNDVKNILESHSAPEVIAELAKQMAGGDDTKTMSFAYGDEPADVIINEFVDQAKRKATNIDDAYFMMNERLQPKYPTLGRKEFYDLVNSSDTNSSDTNVSEFAFGDEPTEPNTGDNAEPRKWKPASWKPWPRETLIDQAVGYKVNEPLGNLGRRAFEDLNLQLDKARKVDPLSYDPITLAEFNKLVEERRMNPPQPDLTDPREQVLLDFHKFMKSPSQQSPADPSRTMR